MLLQYSFQKSAQKDLNLELGLSVEIKTGGYIL